MSLEISQSTISSSARGSTVTRAELHTLHNQYCRVKQMLRYCRNMKGQFRTNLISENPDVSMSCHVYLICEHSIPVTLLWCFWIHLSIFLQVIARSAAPLCLHLPHWREQKEEGTDCCLATRGSCVIS